MSDRIIPIYSGLPEDFHWVAFGSGSGTNIDACVKHAEFKGLNQASLIFSDKKPYDSETKKGAKVAETDPDKLTSHGLESLIGIERLILNGFQHCGSWEKAKDNPEDKEEYKKRSIAFNQLIVDNLKKFEDREGYGIDLIVLGGYMRFIEEPTLRYFTEKIINVHPADLTIWTPDGARKYVGDNAVYDAIKAGEKSTRSSVIIVDSGIDHGEILTVGKSVRLNQEEFDRYGIEMYSKIHQNVQKELSDWPALTTALELIANGKLAIGTKKIFNNEWRSVYLDGKQLPYGGYEVE